MTKVVFVGEAYYADLRPDQGLPPWQGGQPSHPWVPPGNYPDQGLPGGQPYPDQGLPGGQGGRPTHPIYHPGHPDPGLPAYPDQGLPQNLLLGWHSCAGRCIHTGTNTRRDRVSVRR